MKNKILSFLLLLNFACVSQIKILFDNTKAETAGNADWVIDADAHNLGFLSANNYLPATGGGSSSNAQRTPTPAQSLITPATVETYWEGALSSWGIDCVKAGFTVESLPYNAAITFGNLTNPQDLSKYKVFIVDEPNILFTSAEKTAIINFVNNGGGLCMISDHNISDRNGDGFDSPHIWNDLMTNNSVQNNPFGISFDYANFSQTTTNVISTLSNPVLHGVAGNVTQIKWSNGTSMTLNTTQNSTAKGLIFKTSSSTTGSLDAMIATSTFGIGKIVAIGDSSIADDGTGDPADNLYDGYIADAAGNHQRLLMNATLWLSSSTLGIENNEINNIYFSIIPNPVNEKLLQIQYNFSQDETLLIYDSLGRKIKEITLRSNLTSASIALNELNAGFYYCKVFSNNNSKTKTFIIK